jgi:4-hydroxy-tetrahydrodipicolinate reductase
MSFRVIVTGACGRMGSEVVRAISGQPDMAVVGAVDTTRVGEDIGVVAGRPALNVLVGTLQAALAGGAPGVLVDFTRGDVAPANVLAAVQAGWHAVVGTTGISSEAQAEIEKAASDKGIGVLIAPNFALGAVLMMRFAREAASYYEWAEIIELHHEKKIDAPSGTALRTADLMRESRPHGFGAVSGETEKIGGARGGLREGVRVHSVRLPGLVAHQEVLFGGAGETLTLRHDSMSRESFMPGVLLAVRRIDRVRGLVVGLEHLM